MNKPVHHYRAAAPLDKMGPRGISDPTMRKTREPLPPIPSLGALQRNKPH
jgi:hypothetical protein